MHMIDSPRAAAVQMRDPRSALASGELQTDNVTALERFDRAFAFGPEAAERARARFEEETGQPSVRLAATTPFVFKYLLEEAFVGGDAERETIQFHIVGAGEYTVSFDEAELEVVAGRTGDATARVVTSRDTFGGMTLYKVRAASAAAEAQKARLAGGVGQELDEHQLALVAGGKGSDTSCFSDYGCGGDILVCGGDDCGGDILVVGCRSDYDGCAGNACYSDTCSSDYCAGDACGADSGGGGCAADACGAASCPSDACGAAACPADVCSTAACLQDLCGADGCLADYCGADACGAAACAADLCPIDACLVDACAVNLLPIPGPFNTTG